MNRRSALQLLALLPVASALVISERALTARGRLLEVFSSPSGKLTLCPEIVIPDTNDPTAILLQSSLITKMSGKIRKQAKANAAFLSGGIPALKTFCNEQEEARGNFPGPVPVVYCDQFDDISLVAESGAEGILVSVCDGKELSGLDDLSSDTAWAETCKSALENGVQPIPEISIGEYIAETWKEDDIEALVAKITEIVGQEPVSILLSVNQALIEKGDEDEGDETEEEPERETPLPKVPKALGKKIPILGSVRAKAGGGRMGEELVRFKAAGFTGAVLREECIPVLSMSQDIEYLTNFWSVCIGGLKSLKSKSFDFRSKNNLNRDAAQEWARYQMDVVQSGALGDPSENMPAAELNPDSGDYQGF